MNTPNMVDRAKTARDLQRDGLSAEAAAAYVGLTVQRLAQIGGVMDTDTLPDGWAAGLIRAGEQEAEGWM